MFASSPVVYEEFPSSQRQQRVTESKTTQTEDVDTEEQETQFPICSSSIIQADPEINDKNMNMIQPVSMKHDDLQELSAFLQRVTPYVCVQLERNARSSAFSRYVPSSDVDLRDTRQTYQLKPFAYELECSAITWNTTGNSLAVGYSYGLHSDWCTHDSAVSIWNLQRKDFDPNKPSYTIETDSCASCLSFHPYMPSCILVGKFNGEILCWDVGRDDDVLLAATDSTLNNHREPITGLHWLSEAAHREKVNPFASCSLDGKIYVWNVNEKTKYLDVLQSFALQARDMPRNMGIKSTKIDAEVGITTFSFNSEDKSIFLIGTEGGGVFQCAFDASAERLVERAPGNLEIIMSFAPHSGSTTCIQCSPHTRNLFLTCSVDGELRIYTLLQPKPLVTFSFPRGLSSAQWSPVCPLVISAVRCDNVFVMCDLTISVSTNVFEAYLGMDQSVNGTVVKYNRSNGSVVATGSSDGVVHIWNLSAKLASPRSEEMDMLHALAAGVVE